MYNHVPLSTITMSHRSLLRRLLGELSQAAEAIRDDPVAFVGSVMSGDGPRRFNSLLRLGFAVALCLYAVIFGLILLVWTMGHAKGSAIEKAGPISWVKPLEFPAQRPELPVNGDDEAGGGGGGGDGLMTPPSAGELPIFSENDAITAPTSRTQITPPVLAVVETVNVDPRLQPWRDELALTGLPDAPVAPNSDGQGDDGGIGAGKGGGIDSGNGRGVGPGSDRGIGWGGFKSGGRHDATAASQAVDSRPVPLNRPRPNFTEEARQSKVEGIVRVRVLVDIDGTVRQVVIVRGLPLGLNEEAIRAAFQMRFIPAVKDGRRVSFWVPVDIEFNIR